MSVLFIVFESFSLYIVGYPRTHYIDQTGLQLKHSPTSTQISESCYHAWFLIHARTYKHTALFFFPFSFFFFFFFSFPYAWDFTLGTWNNAVPVWPVYSVKSVKDPDLSGTLSFFFLHCKSLLKFQFVLMEYKSKMISIGNCALCGIEAVFRTLQFLCYLQILVPLSY